MPVGGPRLGATEVRLVGSFNPNNPHPTPTPTPNPNPDHFPFPLTTGPNPNPNPNPDPEQIFLVGSGWGGCIGSESCYAPVKSLRLADQYTTVWDRPLCIFRRASPFGGGGFNPSAQIIGTSVAAVETANLVVCTTPNGPGAFAFQQTGNPTTFEVTVDIALNGLVSESTRSGTPFSFYNVHVSHVTPLGGPAVSSSAVTLHGSGLRDYGGFIKGGGLGCKFTLATTTILAHATASANAAATAAAASGENVAAARGEAEAAALAAGTVYAHQGRGTQLSAGRVLCAAPPLAVTWMTRNETVGAYLSVALTLNGDTQRPAAGSVCAPVDGGAPGAMQRSCFSVYDDRETVLGSLFPMGGPLHGGTRLLLNGRGFLPLGDPDASAAAAAAADGSATAAAASSAATIDRSAGLGCRFGNAVAWQPATLESNTQLRCITPANGPLPATGRTAVQVTLNSRDALPSAHIDGVRFAFYNPEHLGPRHLVPDRGGTPAC